MDLKRILINAGIEESKIEDLKESITREIGTDFIPKTQYQKKILALDKLQESYNELEAKANNVNTNEYKVKYEEIERQFNDFKTGIETEKVNSQKISILKNKLKAENFNEDIVDLLTKEFDIASIEIEGEEIKEWDSLANPIKDKYKNFIQQEVVSGTSSANPPTNQHIDKEPTNLREALMQQFGK